MSTNISANFTFGEFEKSDTAKKLGLLNQIDTFEKRDNLVELVQTILQPIRTEWGAPLKVTSGYRCAALNKAVGGAASSAHTIAAAADIQPSDMRAFDRFVRFAEDWLRRNDIPFDQSIRESSGSTKWWHIGLKNLNGEQRRQLLAISK